MSQEEHTSEFWLRYKNADLRFRVWSRQLNCFLEASCGTPVFKDGSWSIRTRKDEHQVIQQYTGCQDSEGKDIFEGDILETDEAGWIATVVFGNGRFSLESSDGGFSAEPNWSECRIIGNVYENPDLVN